MKKSTILFTILLVSLGVKAKEPVTTKLYIGSQLRYSKYYKADFYGNGFSSFIGRSPIQRLKFGSGIFLGLQENNFFSFEIGFNSPEYLKYLDDHYDYAIFKSQNGSFSIKMNFPIYDKINTYTKIGSVIWKVDSKGSDQYGNLRNINGKEHDFGISPTFCLGIEKKLNDNWSTHLEYQWINKIGNKNFVGCCPNNSSINVGISYFFEQKNSLNQKNISYVKKTENYSNKYNKYFLKSHLLFDFNKSILRNSEKKSLDQLCSQIVSSYSNLEKILIFVVGYTDHIGSEIYNYKLSQDRARNVASYLSCEKGFPKRNIIYRGMGKCSFFDHKTYLCRCVKIYIHKL